MQPSRPFFPFINVDKAGKNFDPTNLPPESQCYSDCRNFQTDAGYCLQNTKILGTNIDNHALRGHESTSGSRLVRGTHCLPSFLIIGAMKAGTGELMAHLNAHSLLQSGKNIQGKHEMHYFGSSHAYHDLHAHSPEHQDATCAWLKYAQLFPDSRIKYTFDKSPDILRIPQAQKQVKDMLPSAKLIVLLRDPSLRAVSAFAHNCRHRRYVRLLNSLTHTALSSDEDGSKLRVTYTKGSIMRLDWLVDASQNVVGAPSAGEGDPVFGIASTYSTSLPFGPRYYGHLGCLHIGTANDDNNPDGCITLEYAGLLKQVQQLQHPCTAGDFEDYFFPESPPTVVVEYGNTQASRKAASRNAATSTISKINVKLSHAEAELAHGFFDEQIRSVLQFFSEGQLHIIFQEDMLQDTASTLNAVQKFLGIPHEDLSAAAGRDSDGRKTRGWSVLGGLEALASRWLPQALSEGTGDSTRLSQKLLEALSATTRERLDNIYREHNTRLQATLCSIPNSFRFSRAVGQRLNACSLPVSWVK
eukprot:GSChrysophyteH1.ASY1.ANO1.722.1 assembled CDS